MKQIIILIASLFMLPLASAEETDLPPAKCPGTLESSAVLGGTDLALTVRTRGLATHYQDYPAFEQTLETSDGTVLQPTPRKSSMMMLAQTGHALTNSLQHTANWSINP